VDRSLDRIALADGVTYARTIEEVPREGTHLIISNELFDAFPFSRYVQRDEHLHELWVTERDGELDWKEYEAPAPSEDYFAARSLDLPDGHFADISTEWEAYYSDLCRHFERGLIVTFDYGYPEDRLFRFRRFGTAAAYSNHQVTRDLLANPGAQDLTAHINFTDLIRAGERAGFTTLFFDRQAKFLLALGATEHPLLQPLDGEMTSLQAGIDLIARREEAKRLILPDDIGNDIRVLVQGRGIPLDGWSFQRPLY
jgi:SAM-dependent MidA family methyltransferase